MSTPKSGGSKGVNMDYEKTAGGVLLPKHNILVKGTYSGEIVRNGEVIEQFVDDNLVVNEGLNALLNIMFNAQSQITTWYLGVFEGNYTPVAGVTAATIASAATECTAYDETVRQTFDEDAAVNQVLSNAVRRATFTFNATKSIYGAFLVSNATKGGTAGTLFSAARFSAAKSVVAGDQLLLTYSFTASSV